MKLPTAFKLWITLVCIVTASFLWAQEAAQPVEKPSNRDPIQEVYDELQKASIDLQNTYQKLNNPQMKRLINLATDKTFIDPLTKKLEAFDAREFLIVNLIVLLILSAMKAWMMAANQKWFVRFGISLGFNVVYLVTFFVVIPYFYLEDPYMRILSELYHAAMTTPTP